MYTPQRLFGEVVSSSEILLHEPFLERARLQREQEQDSSARLAMGAYLVARLVDKLLSLPFDNEAAEGFTWQLQAVRRHISELPGDSPETAHLSGVVSGITIDQSSTSNLSKSLTAYAYFLEHEGRLEESLEVLTLAVRSHGTLIKPADFLPFALLAGRLNRLLARWDSATLCYHAALDAASQTGDLNRALRARLGHALVDRARGNLPRSRKEVEDVIAQAAQSDLPDVQSDAHLDLGVVLMLQGARAESLEATYNAFRLSQDPLSRMRILGDLGYALNESGYYSAARVALEIVANSDSSYLVKLNAILELMLLESATGNRVAFERRRQQARELSGRMTPSMAVDYRYKMAVGLARFDQVGRAREIAGEALALAEQHRLNEWYFRIERTIRELESTPMRQQTELQAPAEVDATPAVLQMTSGLREYASLEAV